MNPLLWIPFVFLITLALGGISLALEIRRWKPGEPPPSSDGGYTLKGTGGCVWGEDTPVVKRGDTSV